MPKGFKNVTCANAECALNGLTITVNAGHRACQKCGQPFPKKAAKT